MPVDSAPPPRYSQHNLGDILRSDASGLQLLIVPALDGVNFQKGYVGAEGERAAMEGEVHLKGAQPGVWEKLTASLRTTESAHGQEIELGISEVDVASFPLGPFEAIPTSFPFAIPLMPDVPQCVHTLHSSVVHVLSATLHPVDPTHHPVSRELLVHTRRYTSHTHTVAISPEKHVMHHPVRVEAEIPKSTFVAGEPVPVYVTVPPPPRQLVLEGGLRLRNVKAELLRVIKVKSVDDLERELQKHVQERTADQIDDSPREGPSSAALSSTVEKASDSAPFTAAYTTVMSRSGASCRFHTSRPIRLRFVLHQTSPSTSPADHPRSLAEGDHACMENDPHCLSITQTTLLHSVSFSLNVHASFVNVTSRTETLHTIPIPVNIIPSPAPLPEVEEWVDTAYQKKHDRPPLKTVRQEDTEVSAPLYHEGEAGPSAPPPFEDRDVPPPPFCPSEPSTSNGLPTFQESENEIYIPTDTEDHFATPVIETVIVGEGVMFGFSSSQQFDGHTDPLHRTSTPPPPVEQAAQDPELTEFVDISQPGRVLGLIVEEQPPPPPPLDDPSDPPPSIDSVFRSLASSGSAQTHSSAGIPFAHDRHPLPQAGEVMDQGTSHAAAPPPYLTPNDPEQIARPPPYVDFIPSHEEGRR